MRRDTENTIRVLLASLGIGFAEGSAKLGMRVREALEDHPEPTVVRRAHPLKDWARRVGKRTSHKKACVALARKMAVQGAYAAFGHGPRSPCIACR
ncbi:MAG: hypothetical protein O7B26_11775 [Planctomycetota bacterium]|nr:hypothetical protein [Planctomycetota bacterium]